MYIENYIYVHRCIIEVFNKKKYCKLYYNINL